MLEFGLYINLADESDIDNVKELVKEFYSSIDYIDDNVDYNIGEKSVSIDCLGVDADEADFVTESIFRGTLAIELLKKGFKVVSMGLNYEETAMAVASFDQGKIDYRAITYYEEPLCDYLDEANEESTAVKITGSAKGGFHMEFLDGTDGLFDEIDNEFSECLAASMN